MRYLLVALLILGCRKETPEVRPDNKHATPERVKCSIPEGEEITTAVKVPARCDLAIGKLLRVKRDASFDIGAGAKLSFAKGAGLVFEGAVLTARGTAAEPIVFTSAESKPSPGDWSGLVFQAPSVTPSPDAKTSPVESVLEHAVVEFGGGHAPTFGGAAAVSIRTFFGDTVSLAHVKLRKSAAVGLYVERDDDVKRLEAIAFEGNSGAVDAPIGTFAMLGGDPGDVVRLHGALRRTATLPKLERPYLVERMSVQASAGAPVTLTIADDATLKFARNGVLSIEGGGALATLVAHRVTFTSATDKPAAGDWNGLHLTGNVASDLDAVTFEFAGGSSKKGSAIHLPSDDKKVKVVNSTFRNNGGAAFESWSSPCTKWEDPALKNKSIGQPLCEDVMPKLSLAMLGSLSGSSSIGALGVLSKGSDVHDIGDLDSVASAGGFGAIGGGGGGGGVYAPTKSSVVTESSITASGGLPVDVVRKVVRGRTSSLRSCHSGSSATGAITVTFAIDAKGVVTAANASSFSDESVRSCVTSVFKGMTFPEADSTTSASATHSYAP